MYKVSVLAEGVWQSTGLLMAQLTLNGQLTNSIIGASLSEPHTSMTALHGLCVFIHLLGPTTYNKF